MSTQPYTPLSPLCLRLHQEAESDLNMGQLDAPDFAESRKSKGLFLFYQEEAGCLFVLNPRILFAYLAFTPFPSIMAVLSR